ncbi:glycoside hydrolase domain-containing protein, partial [Dyella sp. EPa41]|uniref:glycoside hydrolase domain-containing protein n=1 Tax=Dyella sp. EPa41 TaxID=1561194 RepID=UPI00191531DD
MGRQRSALILVGALLGAMPLAYAQAPANLQLLRWNADALGNHRYLVEVKAAAKAVHVVIPWRRRDAHPEQVAVIVTGPDDKPVANVMRGGISQAQGELVFEASQAGTYAVYYQPYASKG